MTNYTTDSQLPFLTTALELSLWVFFRTWQQSVWNKMSEIVLCLLSMLWHHCPIHWVNRKNKLHNHNSFQFSVLHWDLNNCGHIKINILLLFSINHSDIHIENCLLTGIKWGSRNKGSSFNYLWNQRTFLFSLSELFNRSKGSMEFLYLYDFYKCLASQFLSARMT